MPLDSAGDDFDEQADAIVDAMLRAAKRQGYRSVVRQIALHRKQLEECADERGCKALQSVIDKLEAMKATMPKPDGYLPGLEG